MAIIESDYQALIAAHPGTTPSDLSDDLWEMWYGDYIQTHGSCDGLTVSLCEHGASFTYLFDLARERIVGAYGMPIYYQTKRDSSRQKGAPLGSRDKKRYVRGHLIAHVLGGGMDINFVPQLRSTNGSAFKKVENAVCALAKQNERCLYFVRTLYKVEPAALPPNKTSQLPIEIEQGVIRASGQLTYRMHKNV